MPRKQTTQEIAPLVEITDVETKEFERELKSYQDVAVLDKPLSFYGEPFQNQEKFSGWVKNEILGGVHWSIVHYCEERNIVARGENDRWHIVAEILERWQNGRCEIKAFNNFIRKWKALEDLKYRRQYAKDKEAEQWGAKGHIQNIIQEIHEKTYQKMGWK